MMFRRISTGLHRRREFQPRGLFGVGMIAAVRVDAPKGLKVLFGAINQASVASCILVLIGSGELPFGVLRTVVRDFWRQIPERLFGFSALKTRTDVHPFQVRSIAVGAAATAALFDLPPPALAELGNRLFNAANG